LNRWWGTVTFLSLMLDRVPGSTIVFRAEPK